MTDEDTRVDRYAVMGYPIKHSRSPLIHRLFALQTNQRMQYEMLQVAPQHLTEAVSQFGRTGGKGANITVPHKESVLDLCDSLSARASVAGAVNTLSFIDGKIVGDNTDGVGLLIDLKDNLHASLRDARILILGAGGATRGIVEPLLDAKPRSLLIANRTIQRANDIVARLPKNRTIAACAFDAVPDDVPFDLVINATSAGLKGEAPPYPACAVSRDTLCYDLSYGLKVTPFCEWALAAGAARSVMGWGMLVEQAAESFEIWRGVRPDTAPVLKQIKINA